jgi:hypothetical protein
MLPRVRHVLISLVFDYQGFVSGRWKDWYNGATLSRFQVNAVITDIRIGAHTSKRKRIQNERLSRLKNGLADVSTNLDAVEEEIAPLSNGACSSNDE